MHQADGVAGIVGILSAFLMVAARNGILLSHVGCVRAAVISGIGRYVCLAGVGRYTRTGMREVNRPWRKTCLTVVAPEFFFLLRTHRWGGNSRNALADFKRLTGLLLKSRRTGVLLKAKAARRPGEHSR
jgi:hypothetical protein